MRSPLLAPLLCLSPAALIASTLVVDSSRGDDAHSGSADAPLATLARAVELAQPGDRIVLAPSNEPLHQSLVIPGRSGVPGKPIIFDGGGRTLVGTRPLNPAEWEEVRPGVYRSASYLAEERKLVPNISSFVARCFMVFDGKVQNMGLQGKLKRPALPSVENLAPGEWTFSPEDAMFYLAISPGQSLAEARIELPWIMNGVALTGDSSHWEIRNVKVHRFLNDGFNFHGANRHILLEDIAATECSDDGMSAHGDCEIVVRRFTAERNATGICHVNHAHSQNEEVTLRENIGQNLYLLDSGKHTFTNSRISAGGQGIQLGNRPRANSNAEPSEVQVEFIRTVVEDRDTPGATYTVYENATLELVDSPSAAEPTTPRP